MQLLLACSEYDQFITMMTKAAAPCLELRQDLKLAAENMIETAKSSSTTTTTTTSFRFLSSDDRRRIELAATEATQGTYLNKK